MKQFVCEMCGSSDLIKQDGVFVCQSCGCKYSLEEAKKIISEGTIDVTGSTVKVDNSEELNNLYELARRARNNDDYPNAQKYYEQILLKEPSSWEAYFFASYSEAMNCSNAKQVNDAFTKISLCEYQTLCLIKENVSDSIRQETAVFEVASRLRLASIYLFNIAKCFYERLDYSLRENYRLDMISVSLSAKNISYKCGGYIIELFGDKYTDKAVSCWKDGITQQNASLRYFSKRESQISEMSEYTKKIQKYDETYQMPNLDIPKSGCYVATCVYGSYDCPQVWTLRRYRDYTLARTWYGRLFIKVYYTISPTVVKLFGQTKWFKKIWQNKLDRMVAELQSRGISSMPYDDKIW